MTAHNDIVREERWEPFEYIWGRFSWSACHAVTRSILYSFIKCGAQGCHAVPVGGAKSFCTSYKEQLCGFSLEKICTVTYIPRHQAHYYNSLLNRTSWKWQSKDQDFVEMCLSSFIRINSCQKNLCFLCWSFFAI